MNEKHVQAIIQVLLGVSICLNIYLIQNPPESQECETAIYQTKVALIETEVEVVQLKERLASALYDLGIIPFDEYGRSREQYDAIKANLQRELGILKQRYPR